MVPLQELLWFVLRCLPLPVPWPVFWPGCSALAAAPYLVPVLYQAFTLLDTADSVRMHLAVGTSLAVIVPTSISSFRAHYRRKAPDMALLKSWIIPVPLGVIAAAIIAAWVSGSVLRFVFAVIAVLVGLRMIFNRESWRLGTDLPKNPLRAVCGFVIGLLSALMGVGGGVLNNTFMTTFGRTVHQAVATSAGVGILISWPGLIGYLWAGLGPSGPADLLNRLRQLDSGRADHTDHAFDGTAGRGGGARPQQPTAGNSIRHLHADCRGALLLEYFLEQIRVSPAGQVRRDSFERMRASRGNSFREGFRKACPARARRHAHCAARCRRSRLRAV